MKNDKIKSDILLAASDAVRAIAAAASDATKLIASSAKDAASVVADNAAMSARALESKTSGDHDLLQRLDTKVDVSNKKLEEIALILKNAATKDELTAHITEDNKMHNDHETRIRALEVGVTKIMTWGVAGLLVLGVIEFLISNFIK